MPLPNQKVEQIVSKVTRNIGVTKHAELRRALYALGGERSSEARNKLGEAYLSIFNKAAGGGYYNQAKEWGLSGRTPSQRTRRVVKRELVRGFDRNVGNLGPLDGDYLSRHPDIARKHLDNILKDAAYRGTLAAAKAADHEGGVAQTRIAEEALRRLRDEKQEEQYLAQEKRQFKRAVARVKKARERRARTSAQKIKRTAHRQALKANKREQKRRASFIKGLAGQTAKLESDILPKGVTPVRLSNKQLNRIRKEVVKELDRPSKRIIRKSLTYRGRVPGRFGSAGGVPRRLRHKLTQAHDAIFEKAADKAYDLLKEPYGLPKTMTQNQKNDLLLRSGTRPGLRRDIDSLGPRSRSFYRESRRARRQRTNNFVTSAIKRGTDAAEQKVMAGLLKDVGRQESVKVELTEAQRRREIQRNQAAANRRRKARFKKLRKLPATTLEKRAKKTRDRISEERQIRAVVDNQNVSRGEARSIVRERKREARTAAGVKRGRIGHNNVLKGTQREHVLKRRFLNRLQRGVKKIKPEDLPPGVTPKRLTKLQRKFIKEKMITGVDPITRGRIARVLKTKGTKQIPQAARNRLLKLNDSIFLRAADATYERLKSAYGLTGNLTEAQKNTVLLQTGTRPGFRRDIRLTSPSVRSLYRANPIALRSRVNGFLDGAIQRGMNATEQMLLQDVLKATGKESLYTTEEERALRNRRVRRRRNKIRNSVKGIGKFIEKQRKESLKEYKRAENAIIRDIDRKVKASIRAEQKAARDIEEYWRNKHRLREQRLRARESSRKSQEAIDAMRRARATKEAADFEAAVAARQRSEDARQLSREVIRRDLNTVQARTAKVTREIQEELIPTPTRPGTTIQTRTGPRAAPMNVFQTDADGLLTDMDFKSIGKVKRENLPRDLSGPSKSGGPRFRSPADAFATAERRQEVEAAKRAFERDASQHNRRKLDRTIRRALAEEGVRGPELPKGLRPLQRTTNQLELQALRTPKAFRTPEQERMLRGTTIRPRPKTSAPKTVYGLKKALKDAKRDAMLAGNILDHAERMLAPISNEQGVVPIRAEIRKLKDEARVVGAEAVQAHKNLQVASKEELAVAKKRAREAGNALQALREEAHELAKLEHFENKEAQSLVNFLREEDKKLLDRSAQNRAALAEALEKREKKLIDKMVQKDAELAQAVSRAEDLGEDTTTLAQKLRIKPRPTTLTPATGVQTLRNKITAGIDDDTREIVAKIMTSPKAPTAKQKAILKEVYDDVYHRSLGYSYNVQSKALGLSGKPGPEATKKLATAVLREHDSPALRVFDAKARRDLRENPEKLAKQIDNLLYDSARQGSDKGMAIAADEAIEINTAAGRKVTIYKTWKRVHQRLNPREAHTQLEGVTIPKEEKFRLPDSGVMVDGPFDPNVPNYLKEWTNCGHTLIYSEGT